MQKVCLLGCTGFIGRSIGAQLDTQGVEWIGIANSKSENQQCFALDLTQVDRISELISECDLVINAIGSLKPRDYVVNFKRSMDDSWLLIEQLVDIILASDIHRFIHISSAGTVYGEANTGGSTEEDILRPKSWYGRTKVMEELLLQKAVEENCADYVCVRVSNPFGNVNALSHGYLDVLINCVKNKKQFVASFPREAQRDFIYVPVMAEMLTRLALSDVSGVYNIGCGQSVRLSQVLDFVESLCQDANIIRKYFESETDVVNSTICTGKYMLEFGGTENDNVSAYEYLESKLISD